MASIISAFKGRQITICFAADGEYLPALGVAIQSIINHASESRKYDICVLHTGLEQARIRKVERMARENVSVRFFPVDKMVGQQRIAQLHATPRFPKEACYRFFIPELFKGKSKVLYMDCDLVLLRDVAELYNTQLDTDMYIGAVQDTLLKYWLHRGNEYFGKTLGLRVPQNYFQSGVMLLNPIAMRRNKVVERVLQLMGEMKNLRFPDQDVLNVVCEGHVRYLDGRWNVEYHVPLCAADYRQVLSAEEAAEYESCYADPWILHFCGSRKPWANPSYPLSESFWEYARQSPFYEELLYQNMQINARQEITKLLAEHGTGDATPSMRNPKYPAKLRVTKNKKTNNKGSNEHVPCIGEPSHVNHGIISSKGSSIG